MCNQISLPTPPWDSDPPRSGMMEEGGGSLPQRVSGGEKEGFFFDSGKKGKDDKEGRDPSPSFFPLCYYYLPLAHLLAPWVGAPAQKMPLTLYCPTLRNVYGCLVAITIILPSKATSLFFYFFKLFFLKIKYFSCGKILCTCLCYFLSSSSPRAWPASPPPQSNPAFQRSSSSS